MMDIKVITRHAPSNYGSLLQSIATIRILESLGHECRIIDYVRPDETGFRGTMTSLAGKPRWNSNPVLRAAYLLVRCPEDILAERKFSKMRHKHLKLTERCSTKEQLGQLEADLFVTGSDQVWGPTQNGTYDPAYFLSFVNESKRKAAYAASFGRTRFTDAVAEDYRRRLRQYARISVREDSAAELLRSWDITCAGQVLDPTLMLTGSDWSKYISHEQSGGYVLIYQIHNDRQLGRYASRFARHAGLPLVRVSASLHQIAREGHFVFLPGIGKFLSYIKGAAYIITDSFHGTAFALNFNRQFIEILPNNGTGSRNQSILKLTGLTDRIITDFNDFSPASRMIDYGRVNRILDEERMKSTDILKQIIGQ